MFLWAAFVIVLCAEPFAHALVETGRDYGISEFFLVQWLAPLASEAPEFIVAGLFAWRLQHRHRARRARELEGEPVDAAGRLAADRVRDLLAAACTGCRSRGSQRLELLLTGAQSLFAVAIIVNLRMSIARGLVDLRAVLGAVPRVGGRRAGALHDEVLVADVGDLPGDRAVWLLVQHRVASSDGCCATGCARPTQELGDAP